MSHPIIDGANGGGRAKTQCLQWFYKLENHGTGSAVVVIDNRNEIKNDVFMKMLKSLMLAALTLAAVSGPSSIFAQSTPPPTPPTVAPHDGTAGLPPAIAKLITSFDATRDAYLKTQVSLLGQLKSASTAAEREQIRDSLQANRDAFLVDLKTFRTELKDDLEALKGKITHEEFLRIIDAAYDFGNKEGGPEHHRGH